MNAPIIETPIRLSLSRNFDAPPQRLFEAFLSPDFAAWLGTPDMVCLSAKIDPRVGGVWTMVHRAADGAQLAHHGVYKQIDRPAANKTAKLVFTWSGGCGGPHLTLVTIAFQAKGGGTAMTLTHEGFLDGADAERHEGGWTAGFVRLAAYLAG